MFFSLDKVSSKKNDKLNFLPVTILTMFSKLYQKFAKELISTAMKIYLSPSISACRQNYVLMSTFFDSFVKKIHRFYFIRIL